MTLITIAHHDRTKLIPLIFEFKDEIERHIIIYDEAKSDKTLAMELKKGIERHNRSYALNAPVDMMELDEDDRSDLSNLIRRINPSEQERLFLNAAGADLGVTILLSLALLESGGTILAYDKEDNSYNIIQKNRFENRKIAHNMRLDDFMRLMNEKIVKFTDKNSIDMRKEELYTIFSDTKKMFALRKLLIQKRWDDAMKKYPKEVETLAKVGIGESNLNDCGKLCEEYVFLWMGGYDFDDIKAGVIVSFEESTDSGANLSVQNEFDILVIKNNRVGFVECKIGSVDPLHVVYRNDALMDYFGEDSRSLIVNVERDKTPHRKESKKLFGPSTIFRAKTKRIGIVNVFDLNEKKLANELAAMFGAKKKPA